MLQKLFNNQVIRYLFFGVLATIVYFIARFSALHLGANTSLSVIVAQMVAILFAFFTNKYFVFQSENENKSTLLEFIQFVGARLSGILIDFVISYLAIDVFASFFINLFRLNHIDYTRGIFHISPFSNFIGSDILLNTFIWTTIIQVIIIVANYFISKYFVFKK